MVQTIPDYSARAEDYPIIGNWLSKIGRMKAITAVQCDPTPTIWVRALWHQIPFLVYTLVVPDCESVIVDTLRGRGHHKRRYLHFKDGVAVRGGGGDKGFGWRWWKLYDLKEKFGWYFTIIDATLDLEINWMSTAYHWSGCPLVTPGFAQWGTGDGDYVEAFGPDWSPISLILGERQNIIADEGSFAAQIGSNWTASMSIGTVPGPFEDEAPPIQCRIITGGGTVLAEGSGDDDGTGLFKTNIFSQTIGGLAGQHIIFQVRCDSPGLYYCNGSSMNASMLAGKWANPVPCADSIFKKWF